MVRTFSLGVICLATIQALRITNIVAVGPCEVFIIAEKNGVAEGGATSDGRVPLVCHSCIQLQGDCITPEGKNVTSVFPYKTALFTNTAF